MNLPIPDMALVVLVGVSGSGKSTFARKHFKPSAVLSSDYFRGLVADDETDQSATTDAFDALHYVLGKRLAAARTRRDLCRLAARQPGIAHRPVGRRARRRARRQCRAHLPARAGSGSLATVTAKPRIGFIGVGLMGHGAARNILERGGYALTVLGHRNREPVDDLVRRGAREADNAAALERTDRTSRGRAARF